MRKPLLLLPLFLVGCASSASYVHSGAPLGRVVVYRNGVAYFERTAKVEGDVLKLSVPADEIDDFLKSLTVTDAKTGERAPIDFPNGSAPRDGGLTELAIHLADRGSHELKLTYVTETPAWKPSYRLTVDKSGKVECKPGPSSTTPRARIGMSELGVGSSSALSFRFDLRSVRQVQRETLQSNDHFALAPPTGGATYGNAAGDKRVVGSLSDDAIALNMMAPVMQAAPMPSPSAVYRKKATKGSGSFAAGAPSEAEAAPQMAPPPKLEAARADVARMAQALRGSKRQVVVEGYADPADKDQAVGVAREGQSRT